MVNLCPLYWQQYNCSAELSGDAEMQIRTEGLTKLSQGQRIGDEKI
jgi:hypothetical protein